MPPKQTRSVSHLRLFVGTTGFDAKLKILANCELSFDGSVVYLLRSYRPNSIRMTLFAERECRMLVSLLQPDDDRVNKANELSLANVGGVFVVLLAGMGLACLIAVFEFIWKSRKFANAENGVRPLLHDFLRPFSRVRIECRQGEFLRHVRNPHIFIMQKWSEMAREVKANFNSNGVRTRNGSVSPTNDQQRRSGVSSGRRSSRDLPPTATPSFVSLSAAGRHNLDMHEEEEQEAAILSPPHARPQVIGDKSDVAFALRLTQ